MSDDGRTRNFLSRLIPRAWRDAVLEDLEDEASSQHRGRLWLALQSLRVGLRLRWSLAADMFVMDLRYALRSLAGAPWFTAGAVLTFALGIGINVAVFAAVDRVLFRRLPYERPESIALLRSCDLATGECGGSFPAAIAFQLAGGAQTIADLGVAGMSFTYLSSRDPNTSDRFSFMSVSPRTLRTLGVRPTIGRDISDQEVRDRTHVAWISDEAWRTRFGADRGVVGRSLWSANTRQVDAVIILGVLPRGFIPPAWASPNPEWVGLVVNHDDWVTPADGGGRVMAPFVRLQWGMTVEAAQSEVTALAHTVAAANPSPTGDSREYLRVEPVERVLFSSYFTYIWLVVGVAWLVGLMACTNLACLFLARSRARERQAAVASALGASRGRLLSGAVMETVCVCSVATIAAVWVFNLSRASINSLLPPIFSRYAADVGDVRVVSFSILATMVGAALAAALPAWRFGALDVLTLLQQGTGSGRVTRRRSGRMLLAIESGVGAFLVLGAVLAGRSFLALATDDIGYAPDNLYVVSLTSGSPQTSEQQLVRIRHGLDALSALPDVASVATGDYIPFSAAAPIRPFSTQIRGARVQASADYFAVLGTPVLAGRVFTKADVSARAALAVMSRSGARAVWPDLALQQIVGRVWHVPSEPDRVVVGVVEDLKRSYGDERITPFVFLPLGAEPSGYGEVVVRVRQGGTLTREAVSAAITLQLGEMRVGLINAVQSLDRSLRDPRFRAALLNVLAVTGLLLASIGLFAVLSYDTAARRYEMGVRLALGAKPRDLTRLIVADGCIPVAAGAIVGLAAAWWASRFVQSLLYRVDGAGIANYVIVTAVLLATAAIACWIPARRAAATDPAIVLKAQ